MKRPIYLLILPLTYILASCSGDDPAPATCLNSTITIVSVENSEESGCEGMEGKVVINASGGEGALMYSLNGGAKQASSTFENLLQGVYTARVEDAAGCFKEEDILVASGVSYAASIAPIIQNSCAVTGCHVAGTNIPNFENLSELQARAGEAKSRTQSGDMPRTGSLTEEEIALIACWVDDGALDN